MCDLNMDFQIGPCGTTWPCICVAMHMCVYMHVYACTHVCTRVIDCKRVYFNAKEIIFTSDVNVFWGSRVMQKSVFS